jgi:hypothetical protein
LAGEDGGIREGGRGPKGERTGVVILSPPSEGLDYVEWGYNRDAETLPQLNLEVLYAENTHLPLYYQLYPGSIPDVAPLKNLLKYLALFALEEIVFGLDRGFYSATNLANLEQAQIKFIITLVRSTKIFAALLTRHTRTLSHPAHAFVWKIVIRFYLDPHSRLKHNA